jgi:CheY-like chemotaxis protein
MADAATLHCCSVLVVDDDPEVRELLRVALGTDGYHVACVGNGREALNHLRSHADTCMILLDLMLPVMNGADFRYAQLHDRALAWIPVILMSGAGDSDRRASELGVRALVRKPLDLDEVKRALCSVGCCHGRPRRRGGVSPSM